MNTNIDSAITAYLANEFQLQPDDLLPDLSFTADLGLTADQLSDLLQRLQDALNVDIPDDKENSINTVGDLFSALDDESEN